MTIAARDVMRRVLSWVFTLILISGLLASHDTASATTDVECVVFPETGKSLCGQFLVYWQAHGGLPQMGFPLTEAIIEQNAASGQPGLVQYFERARLELHPHNPPPYTILLGLIGSERYIAQYPNGHPITGSNPFTEPSLPQECVGFAETSKELCGPFLAYWREQGGLARFGLPISNPFQELNPASGDRVTSQYFERARFEYHPELAGTPYLVLLGLLGREQLSARYPSGQPPLDRSPWPNARMSVTPSEAPSGILLVATLNGVPDYVPFFVQIEKLDGSYRATFVEVRPIRLGESLFARIVPQVTAPAGDYAVRFATATEGGTILAQTTLRLTGANGPPPKPQLGVTPTDGPAGGPWRGLTVTGLTANQPYTFRAYSADGQETLNFPAPTAYADDAGVVIAQFSVARRRPPGEYIAEFVSQEEPPQVIARTTFRVLPAEPLPPVPSPSTLPPGDTLRWIDQGR